MGGENEEKRTERKSINVSHKREGDNPENHHAKGGEDAAN